MSVATTQQTSVCTLHKLTIKTPVQCITGDKKCIFKKKKERIVAYTIKLMTNVVPVSWETSSSDVYKAKDGGGCHDGSDGSILKVKCCGQTLLTRQTLDAAGSLSSDPLSNTSDRTPCSATVLLCSMM